jgi:hypothetical protein
MAYSLIVEICVAVAAHCRVGVITPSSNVESLSGSTRMGSTSSPAVLLGPWLSEEGDQL